MSGIQEGESEGDTLLSGNLPDFVSDFTQTLPYCVDCESGTSSISGTSFSTPRSAGIASKILLDVRRELGHVGGVRKGVGPTHKGIPVMATDAPLGKGAAQYCKRNGCTFMTNWQLRRSLEQAAWIPDAAAYDPTQASGGGIGLTGWNTSGTRRNASRTGASTGSTWRTSLRLHRRWSTGMRNPGEIPRRSNTGMSQRRR